MLEVLVMEYKPLLMGKRFLSDVQLSERLGVSRRTLQDYRDRGILPYYRLDGKVLYDENDIEQFISSIYVPKY
ncbi:MAG: helix-turn-helix domain-containing protein [Duncaniella sp.]|nr:helix-turn-helix domain-containing protein [Duncaniella sp.]